jgi:hypothetical protein
MLFEVDWVFSRKTAESISQHCRSLKSLQLSQFSGLRDEELRILVEGCSSLRSLKLSCLDISEESVTMLRNHCPRIASVEISFCGVRFQSVLSLLREITIPTIFNSYGNEELQIDALENLLHSIEYTSSEEDSVSLKNFLISELLLERLVERFPFRSRSWIPLSSLFRTMASSGYHLLLIEAGVLTVLIRHFHSFDQNSIQSLSLLHGLISKADSLLLSYGILSIDAQPFLQVSSPI